jgi:hypothetical protein
VKVNYAARRTAFPLLLLRHDDLFLRGDIILIQHSYDFDWFYSFIVVIAAEKEDKFRPFHV